jgi:hypothetical protein
MSRALWSAPISADSACNIGRPKRPRPSWGGRQLQFRIPALASLNKYDDSHYLGYVQIITSNDQHNYYGSDVDQRWNFNKIPLSDSPSKAERPWYGVDSEPHIGGDRRYHLPKPTNDRAQFNLQMNMSDDFHMTIAKFETLKDGSRGPQSDYAQSVLPSLAGSR